MASISGYYGSGSVFETTNHGRHVWRASRPLEHVEGGRRFITGTGPTREAALRALENNIKKRIAIGPTERIKHTPTVSEFTETWLQRGGIQASTKKKQLSDLRTHILPAVGKWELGQLTHETLQPLVTELTEKHSAGWHALTTFRGMLSYAVQQEVIKTNPLKSFTIGRKKVAARDADEKYITPRTNIYWRLMGKISDPNNPYHDVFPLFLIAGLGLRPSEALGLEWSCVRQLNAAGKASIEVRQQLARHDPEIEGISGYYIKNTTKNKKVRVIPLPEPWRKALLEQKRKNIHSIGGEWSNDLVFLRPSGRHWLRQGMSKQWHEMLREYTASSTAPAAVKDWRLYYIRHTAVSLLTEDSTASMTAGVVGNSAQITESVYKHLMADAMREAMNKYEKRTVSQYLKEEAELMNGKDAEE